MRTIEENVRKYGGRKQGINNSQDPSTYKNQDVSVVRKVGVFYLLLNIEKKIHTELIGIFIFFIVVEMGPADPLRP